MMEILDVTDLSDDSKLMQFTNVSRCAPHLLQKLHGNIAIARTAFQFDFQMLYQHNTLK